MALVSICPTSDHFAPVGRKVVENGWGPALPVEVHARLGIVYCGSYFISLDGADGCGVDGEGKVEMPHSISCRRVRR